MKGTGKQIAYAEDLKARVVEDINSSCYNLDGMDDDMKLFFGHLDGLASAAINALDGIENAGDMIDLIKYGVCGVGALDMIDSYSEDRGCSYADAAKGLAKMNGRGKVTSKYFESISDCLAK